MNRRHRSAQLAGRASVQLHTLIFFAGDSGREEDAYVLDVETAEKSEPTFTVIVPRYGIEGRVSIPVPADDSKLVRMPQEHKLAYDNQGTTVSLQVFDKVRVRIWVRHVQDHQRELVIELVNPNFSHESAKRKVEGTDSSASKRKRSYPA
jgi:exosome complex exonuclease DIS3/RRP44